MNADTLTIPDCIARLRVLTADLERIRQELTAKVSPTGSTAADRDAYFETTERFREWCVKRGESFPLKLKAVMELVMGEAAAPAKAQATPAGVIDWGAKLQAVALGPQALEQAVAAAVESGVELTPKPARGHGQYKRTPEVRAKLAAAARASWAKRRRFPASMPPAPKNDSPSRGPGGTERPPGPVSSNDVNAAVPAAAKPTRPLAYMELLMLLSPSLTPAKDVCDELRIGRDRIPSLIEECLEVGVLVLDYPSGLMIDRDCWPLAKRLAKAYAAEAAS